MYEAKLDQLTINLSKLTHEQIICLKQPVNEFYCQTCQQQVRLKVGAIKKPHFSHLTKCQHLTNPESDEHQLGKSLMFSWIKSLNPDQLIVEYRLPHINRIADLYFTLNHQKYVIEIQKSLISKQELDNRTKAYESAHIIPIWLFITPVHQKKLSVYMPPLMQKQKHQTILYLNVKTKELTRYNQCLWLTKGECLSSNQAQLLTEVTLNQLCDNTLKTFNISKMEWLSYKQAFRLSKWYYYLKQNYGLRTLCAKHQLSLSLIGEEVGWPIQQCGGFVEPLMLWQSVISCCLRDYEKGAFVTSSELLYRSRYFLKASKQQSITLLHAELVEYLSQLVQLQLLIKLGSYYQIIGEFKTFNRLEDAVLADKKASEVISYLT